MGKATHPGIFSQNNIEITMTVSLGINVNETMESVRYLLHKYKWMAADANAPAPKAGKDVAPQTPITVEEEDQMVALYKTGLSVKKISQQVKRSSTSIYDILNQRKVFKPVVVNNYPLELKKKLIAERKAGATYPALEKKYNIPNGTIRDWFLNPKLNEDINRNR